MFGVHFEKSRDFTGADAEPFQARLIAGPDSTLAWEMSELQQADKALAMQTFTAGEKPASVAKALDGKAARGTVYRWHAEWTASGGR